MRTRLQQREEGFTLIELLVVVIIIGILAAIAIPAFLGQRERARRSSVQSDLRNLATQAETFFVDEGTYANVETSPLITGYGLSDGVVLTAAAADQTATEFCFSAVHPGLPAGEVWSYDSNRQPQLGDVACNVAVP